MMKLALRNLAAEWLLEALEETGERGPGERLDALLAFTRSAGDDGAARNLGESAALLEPGEPFERDGESIRLRPEFLADLPALRERAERFAAARAEAAKLGAPVAGADELDAAAAIAAVLFDHGLFFEVHEWLEPHWLRAGGETRTLLQGLIQVAVGFHHHQNANFRASLSLLSEGNAKLFSHLPAALGLDLASVCREVESFSIDLRHRLAGEPPGSEPSYPRLVRTDAAASL